MMNPDKNRRLLENERIGTTSVIKIPIEGEELVTTSGASLGRITAVAEYPAKDGSYTVYEVETEDGNVRDVRAEEPIERR